MLKRKKILHLIKKPLDGIAREFIEKRSIKTASTIVLIGDGLFSDKINGKEIYAIKGHAEERGLKPEFPEIDYRELVKKIFEFEKVYLW